MYFALLVKLGLTDNSRRFNYQVLMGPSARTTLLEALRLVMAIHQHQRCHVLSFDILRLLWLRMHVGVILRKVLRLLGLTQFASDFAFTSLLNHEGLLLLMTLIILA